MDRTRTSCWDLRDFRHVNFKAGLTLQLLVRSNPTKTDLLLFLHSYRRTRRAGATVLKHRELVFVLKLILPNMHQQISELLLLPETAAHSLPHQAFTQTASSEVSAAAPFNY